MIRLDHIQKSFKGVTIFKDLDLTFDRVGMHVIEGESGSGKSTLLNMIMGIEKVDKGKIKISTMPMMISQNYELIEHLSIKDNILMGRDESKLDDDLIDRFGMREYLMRRPNELSGGQRQRVGIIRALSFRPSIILCDEPTESLDVTNKRIVMDLLKELSKDAIVILVTHDHNLALEYGDHFYRLADHDIKVISLKKTSQYKTRFSSRFERKNMRRLYQRLESRRDIAFSIAHSLLLVSFIAIIALMSLWFKVPDTTDTLNHDYIYVEITNGYRLSYSDLGIRMDETAIRKTYRFQSIYNNGHYLQTNIYPNINDDKGVVINQVAAEYLDLEVGDEVQMYYVVDGAEYPYTSEVTGIIEESDTKDIAIYYNYDEFMEYLKSVPFDDPFLYLEDGETMPEDQYEYLEMRPKYYEVYVPYDSQEDLYNAHADDIDLIINAPLFLERLEFIKDTQIYKLLYYIFETFLAIAIISLELIYLDRDLKKVKGDIAILATQGMDMMYLKALYRISKTMPIFIFSFIAIGLSYPLSISLSLSIAELLLAIGVYLCYSLFIIVVILAFSARIKMTDVSSILKERFD